MSGTIDRIQSNTSVSATMPDGHVGYVWSDTGTLSLKICTATMPLTYVTVGDAGKPDARTDP